MIPAKELRQLAGFGVALVGYVLFRRPLGENSVLAVAIKMAPIFALAFFVWTRGVSVSSRATYAKYIFAGLLFSALGDACLQLRDLGFFIPGMGAFAVAHVLFIVAFGRKTLDLIMGVPIMLLSFGYYYFLSHYPKVTEDQPFRIALAIYCVLISVMFWRALARWRIEAGAKKRNENRYKWLLVGLMGAGTFVISDAILAWWLVVEQTMLFRYLVMATYFLAQLLISLSILHEEARGEPRKPSSNGGLIKSRVNGQKTAASLVDSSPKLDSTIKNGNSHTYNKAK